LRKLPYIDRLWIIAPPAQHVASLFEKIALKFVKGVLPEFFAAMVPRPDTQRREAFLGSHAFPLTGYALFVSGGGGGTIGDVPVASVFQQAARIYHRETGRPTILIAGPLSRVSLESDGNRLELRAVSPSQLSDLISSALLVVSGGGSVVNQALALGRPCLAVPAGGKDQPLRIRHLAAGELIATCPEDARSLADSAARLANDPPYRRKLMENAKKACFSNGLEQAVIEIERCVKTIRHSGSGSI
jgi:hypothetical protein